MRNRFEEELGRLKDTGRGVFRELDETSLIRGIIICLYSALFLCIAIFARKIGREEVIESMAVCCICLMLGVFLIRSALPAKSVSFDVTQPKPAAKIEVSAKYGHFYYIPLDTVSLIILDSFPKKAHRRYQLYSIEAITEFGRCKLIALDDLDKALKLVSALCDGLETRMQISPDVQFRMKVRKIKFHDSAATKDHGDGDEPAT